MSRISRKPLALPTGVDFKQEDNLVTVKGSKGVQTLLIHKSVRLSQADGKLTVMMTDHPQAKKMVGTVQVLLRDLVKGVSEGFEKKLVLKGVGYRAKISGSALELTVGKSHLDHYQAPKGISLGCPSNTEIVVSGMNKQQVGQVAAEIRSFRMPEPYKGKGIRYVDEQIDLKETTKAKK